MLRGVPGRTVVSVDARGLVTGVVSRTEPVAGRDLVTSLDVRVQAAAERGACHPDGEGPHAGLAGRLGAVVVLDPRSGAVAALASAPTYDPNIWTGGISAADYAALTAASANTPLLSRAIGVELAPASTLKPASVVAAVRAGNSLNGTYDCPAKYRIGNRVFNNHETSGRGLISFRKAIQISCDTVFYAVAYDSWRAQGGFAATSDARDPFVAATTGPASAPAPASTCPVRRPGGSPAGRGRRRPGRRRRPSRAGGHAPATRTSPTGSRPPTSPRSRSRTARAAACCAPATPPTSRSVRATSGSPPCRWRSCTPRSPTAARSSHRASGLPSIDPATGTTRRSPGAAAQGAPAAEVGSYLRAALRDAVTLGSVRNQFRAMPGWPVAGKTGTGEVVGKRDTSWFVSYAPANRPRWVVSVVVAQGGPGARTAAPVARAVHETLRSLR